MAIHAMYKDRWTELFLCALVVALISLLINVQNPSGIVLVASFASTALGLMVAPGSPTNTIRAVFLSYSFAILISFTFGYVFIHYIDPLLASESLFFFIKFFIMLLATLFLFGYFNSYHPPAIGAMLTYFMETKFDGASLVIFVPVSVIFLLATIKSYIYIRHSDEFKWKDIGMEFTRNYHKLNKDDFAAGANTKTVQIAKSLKKENIDPAIIQKATKLSATKIEKM